jgi:hypothetical protein
MLKKIDRGKYIELRIVAIPVGVQQQMQERYAYDLEGATIQGRGRIFSRGRTRAELERVAHHA